MSEPFICCRDCKWCIPLKEDFIRLIRKKGLHEDLLAECRGNSPGLYEYKCPSDNGIMQVQFPLIGPDEHCCRRIE